MSPEKEQQLIDKYTKLFCVDPHTSIVLFGFECDDGWYDLLDNMLNKLYALENVTIYQIKEKFGGLRVYACGPKKAFDITDKTEKTAETICEVCGKKGKLCDKHGWYKTLCPEHQKELGYDSGTVI